MKHILFIFTILALYKPVSGQNTTPQDSSDCKFYQGRLTTKILDSGTYIYATSKPYSFIEFTSYRMGIMMEKYRIEKLSNSHSFFVTMTRARDTDSTSIYYFAIDSTMFNKIKGSRKNEENICRELMDNESIILYLFSKFIIEHNLQSEFLYFNPKKFVAWLKIKS